MLFCNIELKIYVPDGFEGTDNSSNFWSKLANFCFQVIYGSGKYSRFFFASFFKNAKIFFFLRRVDFMAMLSDPGAFSKGNEKQAETMKGMGIEQTDSKAEAKKKEEEQRKKGLKNPKKDTFSSIFQI